MNNQSFWESYKAKCDEKGIAPLYADEEAFNKAMIEPPRPYSTDDLVPSKEERTAADIEGWHRLEEGVDDIEVGDLEDWEQVAIDAKKRRKGDDVPNIVKWERCDVCNEMKEESAFAHLPNGKLRKTCKQCMAAKISAGHKKNAKSTNPAQSKEPTPHGEYFSTMEEYLDNKKIVIPESEPIKPVDPHCDTADALNRFFKEAFEPKHSIPLLKEKKPLLALTEETLEALVLFAYEKGKEDAEVVKVEEITPIHAEHLAMQTILRLKEGV